MGVLVLTRYNSTPLGYHSSLTGATVSYYERTVRLQAVVGACLLYFVERGNSPAISLAWYASARMRHPLPFRPFFRSIENAF